MISRSTLALCTSLVMAGLIHAEDRPDVKDGGALLESIQAKWIKAHASKDPQQIEDIKKEVESLKGQTVHFTGKLYTLSGNSSFSFNVTPKRLGRREHWGVIGGSRKDLKSLHPFNMETIFTIEGKWQTFATGLQADHLSVRLADVKIRKIKQ